MNEDDRRKIISDEYADALVEYNISEEFFKIFGSTAFNYIDDKYAVIYFPVSKVSQTLSNELSYSVIPKLYGLIDTSSIGEMGVTKLRNFPSLDLYGKGVLLGFIDTGIDYTSPLFKNADNTSRIVSIWDQTIENKNAPSDIFYYGTEYNKDQINQALNSENPLSYVPSMDENGHGTSLAGLAGGSPDLAKDFTGVAPSAEFAVVKLKMAKNNLKQFELVPDEALCYQENDIMFGIRYLVNTANRLKRPIVICLGLGTNQGGHDGRGPLADIISRITNQVNVVIVVGAGNEGNSRHHYYGEIKQPIGYDTVELNISERDTSFTMELWGNIPGVYSIDITSPSGEYIPRIPARKGEHRQISFMFENTTILVDYLLVEAQTGDQLILLRFKNTAPGIWRMNVYSGKITSGFHIWLPMRTFISSETFFVKSNPYTTITNPGNSTFAITATTYNHIDKSIYLDASKGYSRINVIKPEFAAPGVNVYSPQPNNEFNYISGSSLAAANTTGVVALLLEWGIVRGNDRGMDSIQVKKYLIRGAQRKEGETYPNQVWGFGIINIYGTLLSLSGEP